MIIKRVSVTNHYDIDILHDEHQVEFELNKIGDKMQEVVVPSALDVVQSLITAGCFSSLNSLPMYPSTPASQSIISRFS